MLEVDCISVNNWFLSAFMDADEWVIIPNVLGMGLNAEGGKTTTKPYIAAPLLIGKLGQGQGINTLPFFIVLNGWLRILSG